MLHWIVVDVINVALQIALIPDEMFPIATLPDSFFTLGDFTSRAGF